MLKQKHMDYYNCVCYHQNLTKDVVNNFLLFDDDKPNDHIDHKEQKYMPVPYMSKRKF